MSVFKTHTQETIWRIVELFIVASGFHLCLWIFAPRAAEPLYRYSLFVTTILITLYVTRFSPALISFPPSRLRGYGNWRTGFLQPIRLKESAKTYGVLTLWGSILLLGLAIFFRNESWAAINAKSMLIKFLSYWPSALVQGFLYFEFYQNRLEILAGKKNAIALTALIFALFHFPNPWLMMLALVAGYFWAANYSKNPNLMCLGISHAILGTILHQVVGMMMRVGPFYWSSNLYIIRKIIPWWGALAQEHLVL